MQLPLPSSEHPQVQIETVTPEATLTTTLDKAQKVADIALPEGTDESQVQHFAHFLSAGGKVVSEKMVFIEGSWSTWSAEMAEAVKAKLAEAEQASKAAAEKAAEKAAKAADKAKAKLAAAVAPVAAKVEEHKSEIEVAVATAEITAEVAK